MIMLTWQTDCIGRNYNMAILLLSEEYTIITIIVQNKVVESH